MERKATSYAKAIKETKKMKKTHVQEFVSKQFNPNILLRRHCPNKITEYNRRLNKIIEKHFTKAREDERNYEFYQTQYSKEKISLLYEYLSQAPKPKELTEQRK